LLENKEVLKVVFGMKAPKKIVDKRKKVTDTSFSSKKHVRCFEGCLRCSTLPQWNRWINIAKKCITGEPGEPGDQNCGLFVVIYGIILYTQLTDTNT